MNINVYSYLGSGVRFAKVKNVQYASQLHAFLRWQARPALDNPPELKMVLREQFFVNGRRVELTHQLLHNDYVLILPKDSTYEPEQVRVIHFAVLNLRRRGLTEEAELLSDRLAGRIPYHCES